MARMRSISSIETEISKVESDLLKAQDADLFSVNIQSEQKTSASTDNARGAEA